MFEGGESDFRVESCEFGGLRFLFFASCGGCDFLIFFGVVWRVAIDFLGGLGFGFRLFRVHRVGARASGWVWGVSGIELRA